MPLPKSQYEPVLQPDGSWELGDWVFPACSLLTILCKGFSLAQSPDEKEYFFWRIADEQPRYLVPCDLFHGTTSSPGTAGPIR